MQHAIPSWAEWAAEWPATPFPLLVERVQRELASGARDRLISAAAHDLRSPLNGIQGWAHVLESRAGSDSPLVRRALGGIASGVQQQVRIIEDLSEMRHILAGDLALELTAGVPVQQVLDAALEHVADEAAAHKVEVTGEVGSTATVCADAGRLEQAFRYLLSYMLRCAGEGERIAARLHAGAHGVRLVCGILGAQEGEGDGARMQKVPASMALARQLAQLHGGGLAEAQPDERADMRLAYVIWLPPGCQPDPARTARRAAAVAARAQAPVEGLSVRLVDAPAEVADMLGALGIAVSAEPAMPALLTVTARPEAVAAAAVDGPVLLLGRDERGTPCIAWPCEPFALAVAVGLAAHLGGAG